MPVKIIWWIINKQINKPRCEIPHISKHGKFISIDPGCSSEERRNQVTFVSNNSRWYKGSVLLQARVDTP